MGPPLTPPLYVVLCVWVLVMMQSVVASICTWHISWFCHLAYHNNDYGGGEGEGGGGEGGRAGAGARMRKGGGG